jgi:hypothetical protein
VLWLLSFVLQICAVVFALKGRAAVRYFPLVFFMLASAAVNVGQFVVVHTLGFGSEAYVYFYYYTEALLTILLFVALMNLYQHALEQLEVGRYLRGGSLLLLAVTVLFSGLVVQRFNDHLISRFVVELGQNLNFIGVVLVYLLSGAVMQLRESRVRILQLVFSLGVYFSVLAAAYALRNMFPDFKSVFVWIPQIASVFLAASWIYTFAFVSEDARLATARVLPHADSGSRAH